MAFPSRQGDFIIETDASLSGLGAVLKQLQKGTEKTIAYTSRVLPSPEKNYSASEIECLGLYFALLSFHEYIHLRKVHIRTDHRALQFLMSKRVSDNPRLRAWTHLISVYSPEITYVKCTNNTVADALSRQSELADREPADILADELVFSVST